MKTKLFLGTLILSVSACGGATGESDPIERVDPPTVETLSLDTLASLTPVEGSVEARRRAEMATRMMARIGVLNVDIGDRVRAGQTLVLLGSEDVAAGRAKAEAGVHVAQAAYDEAARHVARMDTLYQLDVVPLVQRDQARLGLVQAEAQLEVARATLREANVATDYSRIVAPFDGQVVERWVDPGDMAVPGSPLLVVESTGERDAVFDVPLEVAAGLAVGDSFTVSRRSGQRAIAPIRAVASGADPMSRTVEVRVVLPADWPTGASVTGLVPSGSRVAITVPTAAVVRRGQLTGVRVLTGDQEAIRWVRLGRTIDDRVEVLSGLAEGEQIVL